VVNVMRESQMGDVALARPRGEVQLELEARIALGRGIIGRPATDYKALSREITKWKNYTVRLLRTQFTNDSLARRFDTSPRVMYSPGTEAQVIAERKDDVEVYINRLESIIDELALIDEMPEATTPAAAPAMSGDKVFVVHGRAGIEDSVALVVERAGGKTIILQEALNRGAPTVVEKLEREAGNACFAVVILTGDDEGRLRGSGSDPRPRARQNVIAEMGYFLGLVGRDRVVVLYEEDVELPSDFEGVAYTKLDEHGAWKEKLRAELRAAEVPGVR